MANTFYDQSIFTPFDIQVSQNPPVTLHGHRTKDTSKPPLALIHGFPQTHIIWNKIAPQLAPHYTLVIPDLRGYGESSKPPAPWKSSPNDHSLYSKKTLGGDINNLMQSLGFATYYVCGHDRGARVTHSLAVNYPQQVRRVMLMDICPTLTMYEACDMVVGGAYWHWLFLIQPTPFPENVMVAAPAAFGEKMLKGLPTGGKWAGQDGVAIFGQKAYEEYVRWMSDWETVHGMCEDYRAGRYEDLEEQRAGGKIRCPIRLLWGDHGLVGKRFDAKAEWAKVSAPGCVDEKSTGLNCGHYIPEEDPEESVRHIMEFFKE